MHYRRDRKGTPLTTPRVGSPSGHGRYGLLDGNDDTITCHECGNPYKSLGAHVARAHDMTADEYRKRHGLPQSMSLISPALRQIQSEKARARVGTPAWERMVAKRDPVAASHSRTPESFQRRGVDADRKAQQSAANARQAAPRPRRGCVVCGGDRPPGRTGKTCSQLCSLISRYDSQKRGRERVSRWLQAIEQGQAIESIARREGVAVGQVERAVGAWEEQQERLARLAERSATSKTDDGQ